MAVIAQPWAAFWLRAVLVHSMNDSAAGSSALSGGAIDLSAATVTNYSMQYAPGDATGHRTTCDVRWNIAAATMHSTYVVAGARPLGAAPGNLRFFALPVNLRSMVGQ